MRLLFTSLFVLCGMLSTTAQKITLSGTLTASESPSPLLFATLSLHDSSDSSMVTSALTNESGVFEMQADPGEYYLVAQYVGFQDKTIDGIVLKKGKEKVDLGVITMSEDAVDLEEVVVRAERSQMEFKLDKKVFNVGKDLTNAGLTAADILDNVPSVTVDAEGNLSLRGSGNVRILVDGKPSGLLSAGDLDALQRMQGDMIQSVEVITNPSARYEAEGEAGVINIILKKEKQKGVNGSFGAGLGWPHNHNASYSLNFRRDKVNLFSNFGINYRQSPGGGLSTQQFFENGQLDEYYTSQRDQTRGGLGGNLQLGTDWFINPKNTITGSLLLRHSRNDNDALVIYRDFDGSENLLNEVVRDNDEKEIEYNFETSLNYRRTFDEPDREWTIDFKYILDDDTEEADYFQTDQMVANPLVERSANTEDEINWLFQSDYVHPFSDNSKMEVGVRAAIRNVNNEYLVERQSSDGFFFPLPAFDDNLRYKENVYAAYAIGGTSLGKIDLQAGLRAEYSDVSAQLVESDTTNIQQYLSLFPSASVVYRLSDENQFQLSYSRRISRPYFRFLLPFSNFSDPRNQWQGNPNLTPEFTDSYELGYLRYMEKGSLMTGLYYRQTRGVIQRIVLPSDDGTTIRFPINLARRDAYGLELNASYELAEWWSINSDLNFFWSVIDGTYNDQSFYAETFAWDGRMNTKFDVAQPLDLQISYNYNGPQITPQGRRLSSASLDIALSLDVLKNKGTLTLSGRDLLNTRIRRWEVDLPEYQASSEFQWRQARQIVLNFTYRLNQDVRRKR
jgi:iron complex outermembrane receptor protein